ncbi:helix-turn-helix transcriptional regulator [Alcanivorax sp. JB21]|uniref:winged helix-turn-helix transcriptional regulator n=1 Tax=Alcanivorax limicola TaxID=2874102 RepID=UPI001CBAF94E|nr:helix-turn-helix domain-containing protein [Alcanivorax limicola]MBZ2190070.1 helix-turn-helix transcriptional regulator [Alcanivorax limicola]
MTLKKAPDSPSSLDEQCCAITRALAQIGDWWSLMIIRQAMHGTRRFSDFQQQLGIARNILGDRLKRLLAAEVLRKVDVGEHGTRFEYRLTEKGRDLFVVLTALRQWGDRWILADQPPLVMRDRATGRAVQPVQVLDADGAPLRLHQVVVDEPSLPAPSLPGEAPTGTV